MRLHATLPFKTRPLVSFQIGVMLCNLPSRLPNTLTSDVAYDSSKDIRVFFNSLQVQNIDITHCKLIHQPLCDHGLSHHRPAEMVTH